MTEVKPLYSDQIIAILKGNYSPKVIHDKLEDYHANDIAEALEESDVFLRRKLYRVCDIVMLAEAFEYLDEDFAGQ